MTKHGIGAVRLRTLLQGSVAAVGLLAASSFVHPAMAQTAQAAAPHEIVVTGSRIVRRDYTSNSPIVTIQSQALTNSSTVTIDNQLQQLPQFTAGTGSAASGQSETGAGFGLTGAATLNLRNLGDNRVLVLLDGRRMQPSTPDFSVDVNNLPSALIQSVEVITGGASAVYGSDAISGVVNFKLKHDFQGLEVDAKGGISGRGDYGNTDDTITVGTNFANERGNIVLSLNYAKRDATYQKDIPFYQRALAAGSGTYAVGFLDTGYYQPELDFGPGGPNFPTGGPAPGPNELGFNTDHTSLFVIGTAAGYNSGVYPQNPYYAISPAGAVVFNSNYNEYATTPLQRYSGFGRFEYKLTDDITAYGQLLYSHYTVNNVYIPSIAGNFWAVKVPYDAAHPVPASFASVLNSRPDNTLPWPFARSLTFLGQPTTINTSDVYQGLIGVKGNLPYKDWTWDIYATHGHTQIGSVGEQGYSLWTRYNTLVQANNYGAGWSNAAGDKCTSGVSPFIDASSITQDCIDYLTYKYSNQLTEGQDVVEADFQGGLFDLPAGQLRAAVGADYRRNTLTSLVDPEFHALTATDFLAPPLGTGLGGGSASNIFPQFAANSTSGASSVYEFYLEGLVPILKDLPLVKSFSADLAYRYSNYNLSGGVNTYKADATWQVTDFLRLRGGYERAVRAPNVTELFDSEQSNLSIPAFDPCVSVGPFASPPGPYGNNSANPDQAQVQALCTALTPSPTAGLYNVYAGQGTPVLVGQFAGNPKLKPEKANTYTAGAVITPSGLPWNSHLSASIDYYDISVDGAIATLNPDQTYKLCFNFYGTNPTYAASDPYCKLIVRAPGNGFPAGVNNLFENQGGIQTHGIDSQIDWSLPVGPGTLDINSLVNYLIDYKISLAPGVPFVDYADTIDSTSAYFRWRSLLTTTYSWGATSIGMRWKFLPKTRDSSCASRCSANAKATPSYNLFDLFATYKLNDTVELSGGIDNIGDTEPPVVGGVLGNTNAGEYSVVGRTFHFGVRAKF